MDRDRFLLRTLSNNVGTWYAKVEPGLDYGTVTGMRVSGMEV